jgi:membrane protein
MQFKHHSKAEVGRAILLILYTFFSVYFDARNFVFTDGSSYLLYAVLKLLQLLLIAMLLRKMEMVWRTRCLDGTLRIALKLFVIFTIGLLLLWPGNWVEVDEFSIYQYALVLKVHPNQGLFSTAIHILGLLFFFHPVSILIVQLALASWIYADIISRCELETGKKAKPIYLLVFTPVALYFLYQPMRTFLFGTLILLFLQRFILLWNETEMKAFRKKVIRLTLLIAGIMCIRTEFKFMILWYPLMLICLLKHRKARVIKNFLLSLFAMVLILAAYSGLEKSSAGGGSPLALNFVMPNYTIFKDPKFDWEANREEVEAIDRVYSIEEILTKTNRGYTLAEPRDSYTKEDMDGFLKSSMTLIRRYPQDYLLCRWNEFVISIGFDTEAGYVQTTDNVGNWPPDTIPRKLRPLNRKVQSVVSNFLGGQFNLFGVRMNFVFWALWVPIIITAELFLLSLWERRFEFSLALTVLLGELLCTMLMAPVKYAMYYFANYMGGWFILYLYCVYKNCAAKETQS